MEDNVVRSPLLVEMLLIERNNITSNQVTQSPTQAGTEATTHLCCYFANKTASVCDPCISFENNLVIPAAIVFVLVTYVFVKCIGCLCVRLLKQTRKQQIKRKVFSVLS